jgi:hypothetical protein
MIEITKLDTIRVIVNEAPNFGNQKACITLMYRLRELGFAGTFDVRFEEKPYDRDDSSYKPNSISQRLQTLINGFKHADIFSDNAYLTQPLDHPTLGKLNITRLPYLSHDKKHVLTEVELACTGVDDYVSGNSAIRYNSKNYLTFQPTGWGGGHTCNLVRVLGRNLIHLVLAPPQEPQI